MSKYKPPKFNPSRRNPIPNPPILIYDIDIKEEHCNPMRGNNPVGRRLHIILKVRNSPWADCHMYFESREGFNADERKRIKHQFEAIKEFLKG
jgi:hypothetical protein